MPADERQHLQWTDRYTCKAVFSITAEHLCLQMKGNTYSGQIDAFKKIWAADRLPGFYRGWLANTLKVTPQNSIR